MLLNVNKSFALFICLFWLTLPLPLQFLPDFGQFFYSCIEPIERLSNEYLFDYKGSTQLNADSIQLLFHILYLFVFSFILMVISNKRLVISNIHIQRILLLFISFFLFKYGFDKIFKLQFYEPEPAIKMTEFGKLDNDILFWSTMGKSHLFSFVTGLIEVLLGILILTQKFRRFALIVSFLTFGFILLINFSFDIDVKLLSTILLLSHIPLLAHDYQGIKAMVCGDGNIYSTPIKIFSSRWLLLWTILLTIEGVYFPIKEGFINGDRLKSSSFSGVYKVKDNSCQQENKIRYFAFNRKPYLVLKYRDGSVKTYDVLHFTHNAFYLPNLKIHGKYLVHNKNKYIDINRQKFEVERIY